MRQRGSKTEYTTRNTDLQSKTGNAQRCRLEGGGERESTHMRRWGNTEQKEGKGEEGDTQGSYTGGDF